MEERRTIIRREADRQIAQQSSEVSKLVAKDQTKQQQRALRRAIRHTCKAVLDIEFSYQTPGEDEWVKSKQEIKGRVLDLSNDGASFFIRHTATAKQTFNFRIDLFDGSNIQGTAQVRWVKEQESAKGFSIGVQFVELDNVNATRIKNFLFELDATLGTAASLES